MVQSYIAGDYFDQNMYAAYLSLENSPIFQNMLRPSIARNLPSLQNKRAYEMGFGTGFCLKILLKRGLRSYTGLDLSMEMVDLLNNIAGSADPTLKLDFVYGDNTLPIRGPYDPYDFVISSFAIYADCYEKLLGFARHMHSATKDDGCALLCTYHLDFIYTKEIIDLLENKYNHYILPSLKVGERHPEFSRVQLIAAKPYLDHEVRFESEYVLNKETVKRALEEAGFQKVMSRQIITDEGHEELLEFSQAWGLNIYQCYK